MFQLSPERERRMHQEAKCEWPTCQCQVPSYALSGYNRTEFCLKLKQYEADNDLKDPRDTT